MSFSFAARVVLGGWCFATFCMLTACLDTGTERLTLPLTVSGTAASSSFQSTDGFDVTLTRADLAFGPFYLCTSTSAGELCEEALFEWPDSVVVNALVDDRMEVGSLRGQTGLVQSYMYDHGFVSLLTQNDSLELDAATALGSVSVVVEGMARREDLVLPFTSSLVFEQGPDVEQGVSVVRSSPSQDVNFDITARGGMLSVRFNPADWFSVTQFEAVSMTQGCTGMEECAVSVVTEADSVGRGIRNGVLAGIRPEVRFQEGEGN